MNGFDCIFRSRLLAGKVHFLLIITIFTLSGCTSINENFQSTPQTKAYKNEDKELLLAKQCQVDRADPFHSVPQDKNQRMKNARRKRNLLMNAIVANAAGKKIKAREFLEELLRLDPINPKAVILQAKIAIDFGNYELAQKLVEDQIQCIPENFELYENLAYVHYAQDNLEESQNALDAALALGARQQDVLYRKGLIEEKRGDMNAARELYRQALDINPSYHKAQSRIRAIESSIGRTTRSNQLKYKKDTEDYRSSKIIEDKKPPGQEVETIEEYQPKQDPLPKKSVKPLFKSFEDDFRAEVVKVDPDGGFIIINKGYQDGIPIDQLMPLFREKQFIGYIKIKKSLPNVSSIRPAEDLGMGEIQLGDSVFFDSRRAIKPMVEIKCKQDLNRYFCEP